MQSALRPTKVLLGAAWTATAQGSDGDVSGWRQEPYKSLSIRNETRTGQPLNHRCNHVFEGKFGDLEFDDFGVTDAKDDFDRNWALVFFGINPKIVEKFAVSSTQTTPTNHQEHNFTGNKTRHRNIIGNMRRVDTVLRNYLRDCENPPGYKQVLLGDQHTEAIRT